MAKVQIKILIIEDVKKQLDQLIQQFEMKNKEIKDYQFQISSETSFDNGLKQVQNNLFDILILDWRDEKDNDTGKNILDKVIETGYIPVIIYSAYTSNITIKETPFCKIVQKGSSGFKDLIDKLIQILESELYKFKISLESDIFFFLKTFWHDYFFYWDSLKNKYNMDELKLMILNRFSFAISREKFKYLDLYDKMTGDPLNFYIYPTFTSNFSKFELGDILKFKPKANESKNSNKTNTHKLIEKYYIILTPTCDFVKRILKNFSGKIIKDSNGKDLRKRKVDYIILAECIPFKLLYENYIKIMGATKVFALLKDYEGRDRYFLLPGTPYFQCSFVDFQSLVTVQYSDLKKKTDYEKVTNLNYPYTQALSTKFAKYFNRIGYDDVDYKKIIERLQ